MEILIFNSVSLKPIHKIYILSKNNLLRICRIFRFRHLIFHLGVFFVSQIFYLRDEISELCQKKFVELIEVNNFAF